MEADAYWTYYLPSGNGMSSLASFWTDSRAVFDNWNSYDDSSDKVNLNRAEFSRVMFIFIILCLLLAVFNKFTGYDSANPGSFIGIMTTIFLMGSISGSITQCSPGFFYLADLFGQDSLWVNGVLQSYPNGDLMCNPALFF
jgi:hypothetical protein